MLCICVYDWPKNAMGSSMNCETAWDSWVTLIAVLESAVVCDAAQAAWRPTGRYGEMHVDAIVQLNCTERVQRRL